MNKIEVAERIITDLDEKGFSVRSRGGEIPLTGYAVHLTGFGSLVPRGVLGPYLRSRVLEWIDSNEGIVLRTERKLQHVGRVYYFARRYGADPIGDDFTIPPYAELGLVQVFATPEAAAEAAYMHGRSFYVDLGSGVLFDFVSSWGTADAQKA